MMEWVRQVFCLFGFHAYYVVAADENSCTFTCPHCGDTVELIEQQGE